MSVFDALARVLSPATARQAQAATVGPTTMTAGEVRAAIAALKAFQVADLDSAIAQRLSNIADDEELADDVLGFLAGIGAPGATEIAAAAKLAEVSIPFALDNQKALVGKNPVRKAQTNEGRGVEAHKRLGSG